MPDNLEPAFVDTNIWLYAFIEGGAPEKGAAARKLLSTCKPVLSLQVINEICVNLIKKAGFTEQQILQLIEAFYEKYRIVGLDKELLISASFLRQQYALSFWDSLVVASALSAQVEILYSEDMQDQLTLEDGLQIVNPFQRT